MQDQSLYKMKSVDNHLKEEMLKYIAPVYLIAEEEREFLYDIIQNEFNIIIDLITWKNKLDHISFESIREEICWEIESRIRIDSYLSKNKLDSSSMFDLLRFNICGDIATVALSGVDTIHVNPKNSNEVGGEEYPDPLNVFAKTDSGYKRVKVVFIVVNREHQLIFITKESQEKKLVINIDDIYIEELIHVVLWLIKHDIYKNRGYKNPLFREQLP